MCEIRMIGFALDSDWLRDLEQHLPSDWLMQVTRVLGK